MKSLTKEEMCRVVEGRGNASRLPILYDLWLNESPFGGDKEKKNAFLANKNADFNHIFLNLPKAAEAPADDVNYRWAARDMKFGESQGLDARIIIADWEDEEAVEAFYANFPSPDYHGLIPPHETSDKYTISHWWNLLFERHWTLRGMENALTDFYLYPEEVHRLYRHLTDFYMRVFERVATETTTDAIFVSDDLGTQKGPMFSPEIFKEFFKPYYQEMIAKAHSLNMHFWLHTCGDVTLFLDDFVEIELDVLHPIQKYTMDEAAVAQQYGDKICILAGFEVQQIIPWGTSDEVRAEVRRLVENYKRTDGRFMITMGNGATADWKPECLEALYDETYKVGEF